MKLSNEEYRKIAQETSWYKDSAFFATLETDYLKEAYFGYLESKPRNKFEVELFNIIVCMLLNELIYRGVKV